MKFNKLNETYWIDSKEVMDQVSKLGKELEADGFKFYSDRYSGSTYYDFYTKRGDNGAICKAVQYSYKGAQIIDITIDQLIGKEPIDGFEAMRRTLGKMLLPKKEAVEEDNIDEAVHDTVTRYMIDMIPKDDYGKELAFIYAESEQEMREKVAAKYDLNNWVIGGWEVQNVPSFYKTMDEDVTKQQHVMCGVTADGTRMINVAVKYPKVQHTKESFEMAAGGDDFDGEIAAMRQEQAEFERRRAARKERFALMDKLFDKYIDKDPNARWIDKIYDLFADAEKVVFIGNKYGTLPGRTEDGQPIRYRYSVEEYDIYTDPYRDFVYIGTTNDDSLEETLEDDSDLPMKASDFKCKLSRYDVKEAVNPADLTDCPECGGRVFDSKRGVCTKCSYRESLTDDMFDDEGNYTGPESEYNDNGIDIRTGEPWGKNVHPDEPIYFDPDDELEVDFRYYVYANNDDVVSDAFDFEEDAIAWAQENNYPIVKIHNYYRDIDGQLNPDGDPEVIWEA